MRNILNDINSTLDKLRKVISNNIYSMCHSHQEYKKIISLSKRTLANHLQIYKRIILYDKWLQKMKVITGNLKTSFKGISDQNINVDRQQLKLKNSCYYPNLKTKLLDLTPGNTSLLIRQKNRNDKLITNAPIILLFAKLNWNNEIKGGKYVEIISKNVRKNTIHFNGNIIWKNVIVNVFNSYNYKIILHNKYSVWDKLTLKAKFSRIVILTLNLQWWWI